MSHLVVEVFAADEEIGAAILRPCDPSMGVASGVFHPNANYRSALHSGLRSADLAARDLSGSRVKCSGVSIEDLGDEAREIYVLGMDDYCVYFVDQ